MRALSNHQKAEAKRTALSAYITAAATDPHPPAPTAAAAVAPAAAAAPAPASAAGLGLPIDSADAALHVAAVDDLLLDCELYWLAQDFSPLAPYDTFTDVRDDLLMQRQEHG